MPNRSDNFNRADNASAVGAASDGLGGWVIENGTTWGIAGNRLYNPAADSNATLSLQSTDVTSGYVEVTLAVQSSFGGVCARLTNFDNGYYLRADNGAGWVFQKRQAGSWTTLRTRTGTNANGDVLRIEFSGNVLKAFANGVQVGSDVTDSFNNTATKCGVYDSGSSAARWDDFVISAPVVSTLTGTATVSAVTASGGFLSVASSLTGSAALSAIIASGSLGLAPGVALVPELRNWGGSLQAGVTIPVVTVCRLNTGAQVLTLTNQVTNGSGNLSITNAALATGTAYMVIGWNADGSQRFAVPIVAG